MAGIRPCPAKYAHVNRCSAATVPAQSPVRLTVAACLTVLGVWGHAERGAGRMRPCSGEQGRADIALPAPLRDHRGGDDRADLRMTLGTWAPYLLPLLVIPLLVAVWGWRAGTDVGADGLTVRAALGNRRMPWSEVTGICSMRTATRRRACPRAGS